MCVRCTSLKKLIRFDCFQLEGGEVSYLGCDGFLFVCCQNDTMGI